MRDAVIRGRTLTYRKYGRPHRAPLPLLPLD